MKKRLLSLLLSLCLVAGLFVGMTPSAYAAGDTQTYTVKSGDSVSSICKALGIDFAKNQEWIQKTNKLDAGFRIYPGQVLTLPAKGKVLKWVDTGTGSTGATTTTGGSTISTGVTTYSVPTIEYTLKNGDFVSAVCKKLGIDFAKNDAWIRAANNITSYNNLKVGRVLILPAPGTTPPLSTASAAAAGGTSATTIAATTTTSAAGLLSGDSVAYYMFDYTVKSGDTLFNICNSVGADMNTVQQLNGITNPAALRVGQKLSIPSKVAPASGSYTLIVAHKVVSGDTVQGICSKYGVDYGKNAAKIKALNNRDNLDAIKVGQTILIPVSSAAVTPSGSVSPSSSGSSAVINGGTGATYYTLNKTGTVNGTYSLTVNGQSINGASAGQVVHVVATPDHFYKLDKITVTTKSGKAVSVDKNNNFVMPASDVTIKVTFVNNPKATPKTITRSQGSATLGHVTQTYVVNGFQGTEAEPGQTVAIILGKPTNGMVITKVCVTTVNPTTEQIVKGTLDSKYYVPLSSNLTFTMPASNVYVTVIINNP